MRFAAFLMIVSMSSCEVSSDAPIDSQMLDDVAPVTAPDPVSFTLDDVRLVKRIPSADPFCAVTTCCSATSANGGDPFWCDRHRNTGDVICRLNCGFGSHCGAVGGCDEKQILTEDGDFITEVRCRCTDVDDR